MSKSPTDMNTYVCDCCGKLHYRRPGNIYKLHFDRHTRHFCCYNCYYKVKQLLSAKDYQSVAAMFSAVDAKIASGIQFDELDKEEL